MQRRRLPIHITNVFVQQLVFERKVQTLVMVLLGCMLLAQHLQGTQGVQLNDDGTCRLLTFLPFTDNGNTIPEYINTRKDHLGFSHMVASILAMEHFNSRDATIVSQLNESIYQNCTVAFDLNHSRVFDTKRAKRESSDAFLTDANEMGFPCAIAGLYSRSPALELSVLSTATRVPMVSHHGTSLQFLYEGRFPYYTQTNPSSIADANALWCLLSSLQRTSDLAMVQNLENDGTREDALTFVLSSSSSQNTVTPRLLYHSGLAQDEDLANELFGSESATFANQNLNVFQVVSAAKDTGAGTIIVSTDYPTYDIPLLAAAAEALKMNQGDYFWIFWCGIELLMYTEMETLDTNVTKLLQGSLFVHSIDGFAVEEYASKPSSDTMNDLFLQSWKRQDKEFLERVQRYDPTEDGMPGHYNPPEDYFQTRIPELGAGFMYDAVMAIGMGACLSMSSSLSSTNTSANNDTFLSSITESAESHTQGIRSLHFNGASGIISYVERKRVDGARSGASTTYGYFNLFPNGIDYSNAGTRINYTLTHLLSPTNNEEEEERCTSLKEQSAFFFANGSTSPPPISHKLVLNHYIKPKVRKVGFSLVGIGVGSAIACMIWIYVNRKNAVLIASQPPFLYVLCIGSIISFSEIWLSLYDESYGVSQERLSHLCKARPWVATVGSIIMFGALFTKLWRVHRVLQFRRGGSVSIRAVVAPFACILFTSFVVLTVWTIVGDYRWERIAVDASGKSTAGKCVSTRGGLIWSLLNVLVAATVLLTAIMAWKTTDVDESLSESKWIFSLLFFSVQILIVSIPLNFTLGEASFSTTHLIDIFFIFVIPMSALVLIFGPKIFKVHFASNPRKTRGTSSGGVVVSGVSSAISNQV